MTDRPDDRRTDDRRRASLREANAAKRHHKRAIGAAERDVLDEARAIDMDTGVPDLGDLVAAVARLQRVEARDWRAYLRPEPEADDP